MSTPYALFITRNDIIKNSPLQGAIDADALLPFVRTSQDKYLIKKSINYKILNTFYNYS